MKSLISPQMKILLKCSDWQCQEAQDLICIVFSSANHPHNQNLVTRALYFSFFYQLNWQSVLQMV